MPGDLVPSMFLELVHWGPESRGAPVGEAGGWSLSCHVMSDGLGRWAGRPGLKRRNGGGAGAKDL